jgi:hypothetical protein
VVPLAEHWAKVWETGVFTMNPYILIAIGIAWVSSVGYAGYTGIDYGETKAKAEQTKLDDAVKKTREAAIEGAALAIAANKPINQTIVQKVQREIQTNTIYTECRHTANGLRGVNEALTGKPSLPPSDSKLPGLVSPK